MTNTNQVVFIGRVVRDTELKTSEKTKRNYASFSVAVNRDYKDSSNQYVKETSFIDLCIHGDYAEKMWKYITKGTLVAITGSLKQKIIEIEGKKISTLEVINVSVELLSSVEKNNQDNSSISTEPNYDSETFPEFYN